MRSLIPCVVMTACCAVLSAPPTDARTSHMATPTIRVDDDCRARGFVGVTSEVPSRSKLRRLGYDQQGGAFVRSVVGCSGAAAAGVQPLDYLIAVDGEEASRDQHFFCLLRDTEPGTEVRLTLLRDGERVETELTIGRRGQACNEREPFPKQGFFGLNDGDTDDSPGVVVDVSNDGPVAKLGMRDGDRLLRVDGHPVNDWGDISTVKRLIDDIDDVTFEVVRDGNDVMLRGAIGEGSGNSWSGSYSYSSDDDGVWINGERVERHRSATRAEIDRALSEARSAIDDIDFDAIERDVREALDQIDWDEVEQETLEATEAAMEAVREAFDDGRGGRGRSSSNREDPADLDVEVSELAWSEVPAYARAGLSARVVPQADVADFTAKYDPVSGRLTLSFRVEGRAQTKVQMFAPTGREVYAFDLGNFTGSFEDDLEIAKNGRGDYTAVVVRDDAAQAMQLRVTRR